jgi:hypothetical protein
MDFEILLLEEKPVMMEPMKSHCYTNRTALFFLVLKMHFTCLGELLRFCCSENCPGTTGCILDFDWCN